jgi:hypothetical protein
MACPSFPPHTEILLMIASIASSLTLALFAATEPTGDPLFDVHKHLVHSWAYGKAYDVNLSDDDIQKTPAWKQDDENPPLSARRAVRLATKMKDSLGKDAKQLEFGGLALEQFSGRWYWTVRFAGDPENDRMMAPHLFLVVLMDGTVPKPESRDAPEEGGPIEDEDSPISK